MKLIIRAKKEMGGYKLIADNGDEPTEGRIYKSREAAYKDCEAMYANDCWRGIKLRVGYEIETD